jgi:hypothetical protein
MSTSSTRLGAFGVSLVAGCRVLQFLSLGVKCAEDTTASTARRAHSLRSKPLHHVFHVAAVAASEAASQLRGNHA